MNRKNRWLLAQVLGFTFIAFSAKAFSAGDTPQVIRTFDASVGELPEGIAAAGDGSLYFTFAPRGEVLRMRRLSPHHWGPPEVVAELYAAAPPGPGAPGALGLTLDGWGNLYCALASFNPETSGVWLITPLGQKLRLPGTEQILWPNSVVFDTGGNLYVTDTLAGAIWRVTRGASAQLWLQHPALEGDNSLPLPVPLGANGIAFDEVRGALLVANTERASLLRIPIGSDGSAGDIQTVFQGPELYPLDGVTVDSRGSIYALVIGQNKLVRVSSDGSDVQTVFEGEPAHLPASLAFGRRAPDRHTLFITNFAFDPSLGSTGPALLEFRVKGPGW